MKQITYAIDMDTGHVWSRVGNKFAIPILDFEGMKPENNFSIKYDLGLVDVLGCYRNTLIYTKKIPVEVKNYHRAYWGMTSLKDGPEYEYDFTSKGTLKIRQRGKTRWTYY